ncbi:MAG: site-2 protease family protein [Gammaproteobacteria bacterium]|nr:site-2 protease family protein [Gammaproteobacteria bacterium]MCK5263278.1 site-2 protease family protein [Gammaproteobacteria bacterium]
MISTSILYTIAVWAVPVLLAITLHEAAHGWMANKLGDPTAKVLGRISLNPIRHIDPIGTIVLPLALLMLGGFVIGWAKPVPVDMRYFKQPILDMAVVALAGPASNFLMACGWAAVALIGKLMFEPGDGFALFIMKVGDAGILINLILMVLNLLPVPPLDGGRVIAGVMPPQMAVSFMRIEPYGLWIVILLLVSGILGKILWPMVLFFKAIIATVFLL